MKHAIPLLSLALLLSSSHAEAPKEWDGEYSAAKTRYLIYSGNLGEHESPKRGSKKVSILIEGQLARELFNSLGPDRKEACGASSGVRIRERGDITCSYHHAQKVAAFTCYVGLNLKTGKSMEGATC